MARTAKSKPTQRRAPKRARGFALPSDVRAVVREVGNIIEIEVDIEPEHLNKLVCAGAISAVHLEDLRFHAQRLIAGLLDFQRDMSVQRTHRKLLRDLAELRGIARSGIVPAVPPSLRPSDSRSCRWPSEFT
jgi:hypothetical protein